MPAISWFLRDGGGPGRSRDHYLHGRVGGGRRARQVPPSFWSRPSLTSAATPLPPAATYRTAAARRRRRRRGSRISPTSCSMLQLMTGCWRIALYSPTWHPTPSAAHPSATRSCARCTQCRCIGPSRRQASPSLLRRLQPDRPATAEAPAGNRGPQGWCRDSTGAPHDHDPSQILWCRTRHRK